MRHLHAVVAAVIGVAMSGPMAHAGASPNADDPTEYDLSSPITPGRSRGVAHLLTATGSALPLAGGIVLAATGHPWWGIATGAVGMAMLPSTGSLYLTGDVGNTMALVLRIAGSALTAGGFALIPSQLDFACDLDETEDACDVRRDAGWLMVALLLGGGTTSLIAGMHADHVGLRHAQPRMAIAPLVVPGGGGVALGGAF